MIPANPADIAAVASLSAREREVLIRVANGFGNTTAGQVMGISPHKVNDATKRVFRKLTVCTRAEAAVIACKAGLV